MNIEPGAIYRHYKGGNYRVVGTAKHSESLDDFVIYEALYENKTSKLWARPIELFVDTVTVNGQRLKRFEKVSQTTLS